MKNLILIVVSFFFIMTSCNNNRANLFDEIDAKYKNGDTFRMQDVTNFEWDSMYVFDGGCELPYINGILGFDYIYYNDIADRIIFVKDKKVIYHEDKFPNPSPTEGEILSFSISNDSIRYLCFNIDNAVFKAEKEKYKNVYYISLKPVKSPAKAPNLGL